MFEISLLILFVALVADWLWGEPDFLWSRLPHPVVIFGKLIGRADKAFNLDTDEDALRYRKGAFVISALILALILVGGALDYALSYVGIFGFVVEAFIVFTLLAQRSLVEHVGAVSKGLRQDGLAGGRAAVAMIVGRDPKMLDRHAISRASIESLAENFSDGVVAPAFWYAVFGLPGLFAYKMINTADSMIGYRTARHLYFGKVAAKIDDAANWLPARFSAFLIALGAMFKAGMFSAKTSAVVAMRDAGLHRSPNAGWPEAALAGAANFALGGPRQYPGETVQQAYLNASGKRDLDADDIERAIEFVNAAFFCGLALVLIAAVLA